MKVDIKYDDMGSLIDVEIDKSDTWSLDYTLASIIYPALIQIREEKNGVPVEFADPGGEGFATQDSFDFYKETHDEAFEEHSKQWDVILDKMIWSFEQVLKDQYTEKYHHGEPEYEHRELEEKMFNPITGQMEAMTELVDNNPDEHWFDAEGHMLHEERIQEGLELFGKYYRSLWT